jgi:hypothetical protein
MMCVVRRKQHVFQWRIISCSYHGKHMVCDYLAQTLLGECRIVKIGSIVILRRHVDFINFTKQGAVGDVLRCVKYDTYIFHIYSQISCGWLFTRYYYNYVCSLWKQVRFVHKGLMSTGPRSSITPAILTSVKYTLKHRVCLRVFLTNGVTMEKNTTLVAEMKQTKQLLID